MRGMILGHLLSNILWVLGVYLGMRIRRKLQREREREFLTHETKGVNSLPFQ
jgi:hypothetical protein